MAPTAHRLPNAMQNPIETVLLPGPLTAILTRFGALPGAYPFSYELIVRMRRAQPIDDHQAPRLYAIVRELATLDAIPMSRALVSTTAAAVAGAIAYIANMLQFTAVSGGWWDDRYFIVSPFSGARGPTSLSSTHPPMAERVLRGAP
jgi:Zn-dependent protease with chaperone function